MKPETNQETKSSLVEAIEQRERTMHVFDAPNFLGGKAPIGKVGLRVAYVYEQEAALMSAYRYAKDRTKDSPAQDDPDLMQNIKTAFILHEVCRDPKRPNENAFPSGKWMLQRFSTQELAVLLNHYNEVVRISEPFESELTDEKVEAIARVCVEYSDTDAPNMAFLKLSREQISEVCIRLAVKLFDARADLETAKAETMKGDDESFDPESSPV